MTPFTSGEDFSQVSLLVLRELLDDSLTRRPAPELLDAMLGRIVAAMAYPRVSLLLLDVPLPSSRLSLSRGQKALFASADSPDSLVIDQVLATRRPVVIENMAEHPDFHTSNVPGLDQFSFLCVPVAAGSQTGASNDRAAMGTLCARVPKAPPVFLERHLDFLATAAAVFAVTAARLQAQTPLPKSAPAIPPEPQDSPREQSIVAVSKSMRLAQKQINQAAQTDAPVLLLGEEGSGRHYLAHILHGQDTRPFQYIENVEELPLEAQHALFLFLRNATATRLTPNMPLTPGDRIIASSSANLEDLIATNEFLRDLYATLSATTIHVPPLRDRPGDLLPLAELFLTQYATTKSVPFKRISTPAMDLIRQYHWPHNARELRFCMERALDASEDGVIRAYHLPPILQTAESSHTEATLSFGQAVDHFEKELLTEALKKAKGNVFQAAKDLRESYRIVNYKVKKHAIDPKRFTPGKK